MLNILAVGAWVCGINDNQDDHQHSHLCVSFCERFIVRFLPNFIYDEVPKFEYGYPKMVVNMVTTTCLFAPLDILTTDFFNIAVPGLFVYVCRHSVNYHPIFKIPVYMYITYINISLKFDYGFCQMNVNQDGH